MRTRINIGTVWFGLLGLVFAYPCFFSPLFDDAYIHARIAEQLVHTGHPGFNVGAALKTESSTGYLLLLSAVTALSGDAIVALRLVQALSVILFVLEARALALALRGRLTPIHGALIALALPPVLWAAYGGMETSTAVVCLLFCATASVRERHRAALLYACLAACLRLELSVFVAFYAVAWVRSEKRVLGAAWVFSPLALCLAFDLLSYRTIVPQAALAKSLAYDLPLGEAARLSLSVGFEHYVLPLALLYALGFALSLVLRAQTRAASPVRDGLMLQTLVLLVAWTLNRSIMFPWYVATFSGCLGLVAMFSTREERAPTHLASARAVVLCALHGAIGVLAARATWIDLGWGRDQLASGVRAQRYLNLADGLYAACPTCSLASSEIGGLGYGFRGTVFDALGLADAAASAFHPLHVPEQRTSYRVGAIPPAYVALRDPDYVVSMPLFSEAFRRSPEARVFAVYDCPIVPSEPTRALWGDTVIQIFAKRALSESSLGAMQCRRAGL